MKKIHILLVEDNEGDIYLTTEALEEKRIINQISVVKDGQAALDFIFKRGEYSDAKMPDLILLDVNLPKKNGHEVLAEIKSDEISKHIPVIVLTTSSSEKDINSCYKNHANCYITKPVEADQFLQAVSTIEGFWLSIVSLPKN
jgi:CheY-like chemotaxis protein